MPNSDNVRMRNEGADRRRRRRRRRRRGRMRMRLSLFFFFFSSRRRRLPPAAAAARPLSFLQRRLTRQSAVQGESVDLRVNSAAYVVPRVARNNILYVGPCASSMAEIKWLNVKKIKKKGMFSSTFIGNAIPIDP